MSAEDLKRAVAALKAGDVVAMPTETVYGLAGDIDSEAGLKRIFAVKERPFFDPLIVHVDTVEKARALALEWTPVHDALVEHCWPGPLTLVVAKHESVNPLITAGLAEVGLRCPRHPLALALLREFRGLAAPSANKFGKTSPTTAEHVRSEFGDAVAVLDGGPCEVGIESTVAAIVREDGRRKLVVYRPGFYTAAVLHDVLEDAGFPTETTYAESPVAPGQLEHHYMPSIPVVTALPGDATAVARAEKALKRTLPRVAKLDLGDDPQLAARMFYEQLRGLSTGHDAILVEVAPAKAKSEDWRALMNRLQKAASFKG